MSSPWNKLTSNYAPSTDQSNNASQARKEEHMAITNKWDSFLFTVSTIKEASQNIDAGIFIFASSNQSVISISWKAHFIGETYNFQTLKSHPLWALAEKMGATHVHILVTGEEDRKNNVDKLINMFSPALNQSTKIVQPNLINTTEEIMSNNMEISGQLSETKNKLELLYQYEKHYLGLIKEYKEEIKFANTLQEDLRRERTLFFTQTLKDVIQTMKIAEVDNGVSAQWIQELVASYTKSIDLSSDLAKTHVIEILSILTAETKREAADAQLDTISKKADAS